MSPRLADLAAPLGVLVTDDRNPAIAGLTCDSRKVAAGFLFAALPGAKADGRSFIARAVEQGAVAILAPPGTQAAVPVIESDDPRHAFALMAAAFHGRQPAFMAAVTGTNGKTSTANFARQIWARLNHPAAALGTLGVIAEGWPRQSSLTTPDSADLHQLLAELAQFGITHACMEASSHGLDQSRLDGVSLKAAAFTNLSRDHLDYHPDMAAYWVAKRRLFDTLLPQGGAAIINADQPQSGELLQIAQKRGQTVLDYGRNAQAIQVIEITPTAHGQDLDLVVLGQAARIHLPLAGRFQVENALAALGLVLASGVAPQAALNAMEGLTGVPGRLQQVGVKANGAAVYVDYAHTPDALETVIAALKPHARARLVVLFGCGGDRDPGKRPIMGEIAARLADHVIITDDNPRSEDPARIRAAILATCPNAEEIADRGQAIDTAITRLQPGDLLILAGKGHEEGQIIQDRTLPFSDALAAQNAILKCDRGAS